MPLGAVSACQVESIHLQAALLLSLMLKPLPTLTLQSLDVPLDVPHLTLKPGCTFPFLQASPQYYPSFPSNTTVEKSCQRSGVCRVRHGVHTGRLQSVALTPRQQMEGRTE